MALVPFNPLPSLGDATRFFRNGPTRILFPPIGELGSGAARAAGNAAGKVIDVPSWERGDFGRMGGIGGKVVRGLPYAAAAKLGWDLGTPVGKFIGENILDRRAEDLPYYSVDPSGRAIRVGTGSYGGAGTAPAAGAALGAFAAKPPAAAKKTSTRNTASTRTSGAATGGGVTGGGATGGSVASDPLTSVLNTPTQVATDFGSFVSSLETAPMYRGPVGYSEVLGRYVRPGDYQGLPTYVSPEQYQADVERLTANVGLDPSQRSTAGPLGMSAYNLVPTYSGVRSFTNDPMGYGVEGPTTYRSSADAFRIATQNATAAQLADPNYRAVLESFAREGGLIGPSAEEQALLRQRIEAEMAAAQQRGQQAIAQWNQMNPGISNPTPQGTSVSGFVPFIGVDRFGNSVLANDPQAMEKIRQGLIQSMGGGYDPFQNPYEQQAMAQGFGNRGETGYTPV